MNRRAAQVRSVVGRPAAGSGHLQVLPDLRLRLRHLSGHCYPLRLSRSGWRSGCPRASTVAAHPRHRGGGAGSAPARVSRRSGEPIIELRDLCRAFNDRPERDRIDLTMARGEVVVVLGSSGSGKSTRAAHALEAEDHRFRADRPSHGRRNSRCGSWRRQHGGAGGSLVRIALERAGRRRKRDVHGRRPLRQAALSMRAVVSEKRASVSLGVRTMGRSPCSRECRCGCRRRARLRSTRRQPAGIRTRRAR